eukprot:1195703-Prorocentrum_minimum.AAC.6
MHTPTDAQHPSTSDPRTCEPPRPGPCTALTGRFTALTGRFTALTGRFNALTGRFTALTGRFNALGRGSLLACHNEFELGSVDLAAAIDRADANNGLVIRKPRIFNCPTSMCCMGQCKMSTDNA